MMLTDGAMQHLGLGVPIGESPADVVRYLLAGARANVGMKV